MSARRVVLALACVLAAAPVRAASLLADLDRSRAQADDLAAALATATLTRDGAGLRAAIARVEALDAERRAARLPPTGLADEARLLAIARLPTAAARRQPVRELIRRSSGDLERLARGLAASDETLRAERLLADDRHDRRATLVNDAIRPFGVGTNLLAVVNPVLLAGSALDAVLSTTRNVLRYGTLSTRERDALATYRAAVARSGGSERSAELARATQALSAKRRRALCQEALGDAKKALE
ncbi:MAG TPA: hypothetical protein VNO26_09630, partial [Candidatus Limnocylindria bacterium]|nr:hypothetical protein [Candidatus Limnocylindria bacterium]